MRIAIKTLEAIENAFAQDQGAKYRGFLKQTMPQCADAYSTDEAPFRKHLGASLVGRECARELWYSFHWCVEKKFDGRMLRLFNRGHLEEGRMFALFMMIGCQVWLTDANGKQFRITGHRGHFGGSMDAVIRGIPDIPDESVLGEFKTHNDKSFAKLVSEGVISAKWEHFVQMQVYMGKNNLNWAIYGATNKNDDSLHLELVQFDPGQYQRYLDRSAMIVDAKEPPPRISSTPGHFKCKRCDMLQVCHIPNALPAKNCRTCTRSSVGDNGVWYCQELIHPLPFEKQLAGCNHYQINLAIK